MKIKYLKLSLIFIICFLLNCTNKNESSKKTPNKDRIVEYKINCFDFDKLESTKLIPANGCAGFLVYSNIYEQDFLIISGQVEKYKIDSCYTFDLKDSNELITLHIDRREKEKYAYNAYCTDIVFTDVLEPTKFLLIEGRITMKITKFMNTMYFFDAYLENTIFVNRTDTIKLNKVVLKKVDINHIPG